MAKKVMVRRSVGNQTIAFGALTIASAGGAKAVNSVGTEVDFVSVTSQGAGSGWTASSGRLIRSTGTPATQNGVVLTCTVTGGYSISVTISTIALGWSVMNIDQLEAAAEHASLAYGDTIYLRAGIYNSAAADKRLRRTVAMVGTFTPPSDHTDPDQGPDLDTANYVKITRHAGATATIAYVVVQGDLQSAGGFRFTDINFARVNTPGTPIASPDSNPMLNLLTVDNIAVDNCTFTQSPSGEEVSDVYSSIRLTGGSNIKIIDNEFYDTWNAFVGTGRHDGLDFIGNFGRRQYNDCAKFFGGDDIRINWNTFYDKKQPGPDALAHVDYFQFSMTSVNFSPDNIRFIGNRLWRADGSAPQAATSNPATEGLDGQGIFIDDLTSSFTITNLVIACNTITSCVQRGISVTRATAPIIVGNTTVHDRNVQTTNQQNVGIHLNVCNGGTVRYNIANGATTDTGNTGTPTISDNINASRTAVSPAADSYEELFTDPDYGSVVTDVSVNFAIKTGGDADDASPKIGAAGTGYVNYAARTFSHPSGLV